MTNAEAAAVVLPGPSLTIDAKGWCRAALCLPSPNHNLRSDGVDISMLVIHNISLPRGEFGCNYIDDLFLNQLDLNAHPRFATLSGVKVSSHFLIRRDGRLVQFVSTFDRAWHAGVSTFGERNDCNDFSIGIELEGTDDQPFEAVQYETLIDITHALLVTFPIEHIVGHADIAPGRKTDPGAFFEWKKYQQFLTCKHNSPSSLVLTSVFPSFPFVV